VPPRKHTQFPEIALKAKQDHSDFEHVIQVITQWMIDGIAAAIGWQEAAAGQPSRASPG
jgi:hypothetical protein